MLIAHNQDYEAFKKFGCQMFLKASLKIPLQNLRSKCDSTSILNISWKNIETLLTIEFYCFERNQFRKYRELRYGRFCSFFAIIWTQNPQLGRYWADNHR